MSQFKGSIQQINSFVAILLPAKSGFSQMCLVDNIPDTADCEGLRALLTQFKNKSILRQ